MQVMQRLLWALAASAALSAPARADGPAELWHGFVAATDGVPLAVTDCGSATAPGVLLIHGFGQSYLSFKEQFTPALCSRFHLVAFDLRGHGGSGKPWEPAAYATRERWADDVKSVIEAQKLDRPLVVGWSFGGTVAVHYVAVHGTGKIRGLMLVGSGGGIVPAGSMAGGVSPEQLARYGRAAATPDIPGQIEAAEWSQSILAYKTLAPADTRQLVQASLMLPAYVRVAMRSMPVDNAGLEGKLTLPVRFAIGAHDATRNVDAHRALAAKLPHASVVVFADSGHSPFLEEPQAFNKELISMMEAP